MALPYYFYDINATMPGGIPRWVDEFAKDSDSIFQPHELSPVYQRRRYERNVAYSKWLAAFFVRTPTGGFHPVITPKMMKWQVVQIMTDKHSETNRGVDWWPNYQDALFRVFLQPETLYDEHTGEHKQWYLLSPEDSYLVNKHEIEKESASLTPRDYRGVERFLSADPRLRKARLVPVECCRHWRHETTAGQLPEGL